MRKILILILLILFIISCLLIKKDSDEAIPVFSVHDFNYQIYDIDVSNSNITTKNIVKYYPNYTILSIDPDNNPIYEKIIPIKTYNFDTNESLRNNIDEFLKIYLKAISKHHLIDDYYKIKYNGIKINKISFYVTKSELDLILMDKDVKMVK